MEGGEEAEAREDPEPEAVRPEGTIRLHPRGRGPAAGRGEEKGGAVRLALKFRGGFRWAD